MTPQEELHQILEAMMQQIEAGSGVSDGGPALADHVRRIDQLKEQLGEEAPAMLQHYLEKRSYANALDFLEGGGETLASNS